MDAMINVMPTKFSLITNNYRFLTVTFHRLTSRCKVMAGEVSQVLLLAVVAVTLPYTTADISPQSRLDEAVSKFGTGPSLRSPSEKGVTVHPPVDLSSSPSSPYAKAFDDPYWKMQWYAQDYRTQNTPVMDLNLVPVYRMGITGKGVVVAVVDDGVDETHPDLKERCRNDLSYDMCKMGIGCAPHDNSGIYGTMAAGIIAMQANNRECGVGVAYDAKIAGVLFYCQHYTHAYHDSFAIQHRAKEIDISLNLWNGHLMKYHGEDVEKSFIVGRKKGRGEKGTIYIFAGAMNTHKGVRCSGNSLLQVPEVIVVNGASHNGKRLSYGDRCSAVMATAYAFEREGHSPGLVSTLPGGLCGEQKIPGTWAPAAFAAGVLALILEARSELMYRDVMHIIAMGSEVAPLADNANTWHINSKGFWFSNDFGFGLLNAENMVKLANSWILVPEKNVCKGKVVLKEPLQFTFGKTKAVKFVIMGCKDNSKAVNYLEHVVVWLNISYKNRGALQVNLVSPGGTDATIMEPQPADSEASGLDNWRVTSLHSWGESPTGDWRLRVTAKEKTSIFWRFIGTKVVINNFEVELHGTATPPEYPDRLPRRYTGFRLADGRTSEDPFPKQNKNKQNVDEEIAATFIES